MYRLRFSCKSLVQFTFGKKIQLRSHFLESPYTVLVGLDQVDFFASPFEALPPWTKKRQINGL